MKKTNSLHARQGGLVSIIVTMLVMFILSITVMSFATLMRREQRQVLDRQLNTQAFYAAEAGINDAVAVIKQLALSNSALLNGSYTSNCNDFQNAISSAGFTLNQNINPADSNVTYSCLLVDPRPDDLSLDRVTRDPQVMPVKAASGNISSITISWQEPGDTPGTNFNCPGAGGLNFEDLASSTEWVCSVGLLRVDLVPTPTTFDRNHLNSNLRTMFLYPRTGGPSSFSLNGSQTGHIVGSPCTNSPSGGDWFCKVTINVLAPGPNFYLRMSSIYKDSAVKIRANSGPTPVELIGSQVVVDATGKANDVLRRMQVRVSIDPLGKGPYPLGAIQSVNSLCKQFSVIPPSTVSFPAGIDDCGIN